MPLSSIRFKSIGRDQLLIEKLPDQTTAIFHQVAKSVHSLNQSATLVWEICREAATPTEIKATLELHYGQPVDDDVVSDAIEQLQAAGLLVPEEPSENFVIPMERRAALKALGAIGGMALP